MVAIYLTGSLPAGCGPHDVAIALVGKLFKSGYVKNKVMEFVGPGIASLRQDTRNAIDAMTTETTCLSSIWETDEVTQRFLAVHGRAADYKKLAPADLAYYDGVVEVDLSAIRPMIALPMHPSNAFTIEELNANLEDILHACEQDVQKLIGGLAYIVPPVQTWNFEVGVAGAGFLALAVMIFGQWKPFHIFGAAMFFAVFKSLANIADSTFLAQLHWSSNIYNMMPFVASMVILAFTSKNSMAPKAEGIPYDKGSR